MLIFRIHILIIQYFISGLTRKSLAPQIFLVLLIDLTILIVIRLKVYTYHSIYILYS